VEKRGHFVTLTGDDSSVRLTIVGYQFPEIIGDEWDSNWLIVDGSASLEGRDWRFRDPCLTTFEAIELANWLEACARGTAGKTYCGFTEPNLEFELLNPQTLRISFALEAAPPWSKAGDELVQHSFNVPVGPSLSEAAADLHRQLQNFPVRGPIES
jgi:hypothetical protein